jgi:microcystin degradation protein MlrC
MADMTLVGIVIVCGHSLAGCAPTGPVSVTLPADAPFTGAMAEIAQETNSFSPVPTTLRDFEAAGLLYGQDVIACGATKNTALGGFLQAIADHGDGKIAVRLILRAWAMSGGPVERGVYERLKKELLDGLADAAWSIRAVPHPKSYSAEEAVAIAKKRWLARNTGAIVICDVADALGAGAPGENTRIPRPVYPLDDVEGWR